MNEPTLSPTILIEAIEVVDQFLEQIKEKEQDCLRRIFLRYCLTYKLVGADFTNVVPQGFPDSPNYVEWYYKVGKKQPYLLMTRRIVATAKDGVPTFSLDITFNSELVHNNEL